MDKSVAYQKLESLVARFTNHYDEYKVKSYNETQVRQDFINPFFEIFNWDTGNIQNLSESAREVVHEDKVKVLEKRIQRTKAPDYSFNLEGKRLFFVEAKKPSVFIKEECEPAYQLRRYAWSAKLKISILTDFEEFAVYDCLKKPNEKDKSSYARIKYIHYTEYLTEFDYLWEVFEKNNVLNGSLNKYFLDASSKKGIESVDDDFLNTLDGFRTTLASDISKQNMDMLERDINIVVQKTIDRIIFLRIAEDRDIEEYGKLNGVLVGDDYYQNLYNIFDDADRKYNSGLFENDELSRSAVVSNKVVKNIISDLYFPKSPYEFSVLSVEILGSAYEQFLGKTITLDKNHKSKIEYKPEVRKAGGVYYTPEYIVKYIVLNTLGALIKNKTPKQIELIKIVDPSCGSGSFLIGAYEYLLNFHETYYLNNPPSVRHKKESPIGDDNKLTVQTKKRILVNNIFGVDIDAQAVEVTKLSLMLKCLEGENSFSINEELGLFGERALPSMEDNIKCGNSLIGTDFYDSSGELDFGDSEIIYKINAFDWEAEFPSVFAGGGGFDVVIGNPPYVKEYTDREAFENIKLSYLSKYYQGKMDLWYFFVCHGLDILKEKGKLGFIAPSNWITNAGASILRNKILSDSKITDYVDFGDFKVFRDAGIQTMVFVLSKQKIEDDYKLDYYKVTNKNIGVNELADFTRDSKSTEINDISHIKINISSKNMMNNLITFVDSSLDNILNNIKDKSNYYFNEKEITNGIHHHHDYVDKNRLEILGDNFNVGNGIFVLSHDEKESLNLTENELTLIKPAYTTKQLGRYFSDSNNMEWVIYTDSSFKNVSKIKPYPNIKKHLDKFKKVITSDNAPYGLHRTRKEDFFIGEKIISLRKCSKQPTFTYVDFDSYVSATFYVIKPSGINLKYLTAILNSKLIAFWLKNKGKMQGDNYQVDKAPLLEIPIHITDDKAKHDELVKLVTVMIDLNKKLKGAGEKSIVRIIEATDRKIDSLVYSLYNLSEGEILLVEAT